MPDRQFQAIEIVVVEVNQKLLLLPQTSSHLFTAIVYTSWKLCRCLQTDLFLYDRGKTKIYKDGFIEGRTPHYVLGFNINVNDIEVMENSQILKQLFFFKGLVGHLLAWFHCYFYAVMEHQDIETKMPDHFWSTF